VQNDCREEVVPVAPRGNIPDVVTEAPARIDVPQTIAATVSAGGLTIAISPRNPKSKAAGKSALGQNRPIRRDDIVENDCREEVVPVRRGGGIDKRFSAY